MYAKHTYLLLAFCATPLFARLTTLQHYDPDPVYSSVSCEAPPGTHLHLRQTAYMKGFDDRRAHVSFSLAPFVQRATKATGENGTHYNNDNAAGTKTGDFRGTTYVMGLFLGNDANGLNIWGNDAENTNNLNFANTLLPANLKTTGQAMQGVLWKNTDGGAATTPSIFSETILQKDANFGAFSYQTEYQRVGLRTEANIDFKYLGFSLQGGVSQVKHENKTFATSSLTDTTNSPIYTFLTHTGAAGPQDADQNLFNQNIVNNLEALFAADGGIAYDTTTYESTDLEDVRASLHLRYPVHLHGQEDDDSWTSLIVTPYMVAAGSFPSAPQRDYTKAFSLSAGNNGHPSAGGTIGCLLDFAETVEAGFEAGITYFLGQNIAQVPCPNHKLQRVIYPYKRDMHIEPGYNWHFGASMTAYDFIENTNFYFTYTFVQHTKDTHRLQVANANFLPQMLDELSEWNAHLFNASLNFTIHQNIQVGLTWQGALKQRNAYASHTILGSISAVF